MAESMSQPVYRRIQASLPAKSYIHWSAIHEWYNLTKSIVVLIAALLVLAAAQASPSFAQETEPIIRVEPATCVASSIGEVISINITVTDAENVNGWQIHLLFAPSLLVVSDYEFGDFMRNAGIPTLQTFGNSSLIGHVYAAEAAAFDVVSGSGILLRLNLTVLDSGCSSLHLNDTQLLDADLIDTPHAIQDGAFIMTSHPVDYNDDSVTDSYVNIVTNSTYLDSFTFNETGKYITFRAGGEQDTAGHSNVTIPKNLLDANTPSEWNVFTDNNVTMFLTSSNDTYTSIYLTYNQGLHIIRITGDIAVPEFPSVILSALTMIGIAVVIMARRNRFFLKKR